MQQIHICNVSKCKTGALGDLKLHCKLCYAPIFTACLRNMNTEFTKKLLVSLGACSFLPDGKIGYREPSNFSEFEQIFGVDSPFGVTCMKCTLEFREIHEARVSKAKTNGTTAGISNVDSLHLANSFSTDHGSVGEIPGNINDKLNNVPKGSGNGSSTESVTSGSGNVMNRNAPSAESNAVGSDNENTSNNEDAEIDDSLCIHVSKFDPSISYMDVVNVITEKTSLVHKTNFTVIKLYKRRFNKVKPTFVSFKIIAKDKDIFDIIISPDVWGPEFKASPYDRSISKAKAMERRSIHTCRKLIPPQNKANTDSMHGKQKNNHQIKHHHLPLNKPQLLKPQNNQHQKQQQHPKQQPIRQQIPQQQQQSKRQQKSQQQQQQPHGHQKKHQQQPQRRRNKQHYQRRGNQNNSGEFNNPTFNSMPHPGIVNPYRGSNFHPTWWNNQAPVNNTFNRKDQLFSILQQFFAQQPQY